MNQKVSIIIPVYNVEKYISRCLDSIINQTYQNIEIILINDGSSDNSAHICEEYANKDNRIKYIYQENKGVSSARNNGINYATGEYITFVDSDDWLELDAVEHMLKIINEYNVDVVRTSFKYHMDASVNKIEYENEYKDKIYDINNLENFEKDLLLNKKQAYLWILMIKSEFVKKIKFDVDLGMMEDTIWVIQLLKSINKMYFSNTITYNYVLRYNSASNSLNKSRRNLLNALYIKRFYDQLYLKDNDKKTLYSKGLLGVIVENIHKYCLSLENTSKESKEFLYDFSINSDFLDIVNNGDYKNLRIDRKILLKLLKDKKINLLINFCKIKEFAKGGKK